MALDPTNAIAGTLTVDVGGDERGGGNYPAVDAGRPCVISWEELKGVAGGASFASDRSGVGAGDKTVTAGSTKLKNGLCDIDEEGSQGSDILRITVNGCVDAT